MDRVTIILSIATLIIGACAGCADARDKGTTHYLRTNAIDSRQTDIVPGDTEASPDKGRGWEYHGLHEEERRYGTVPSGWVV